MRFAEYVGLLAGGIGFTQSIPQSLRLRRLGHGNGLSKITWLLNFILNSTWIGYGIHTKSTAVTLTNSFGLVMTTSIVLVLLDKKNKPNIWLPILGLIIILTVTQIPSNVTNIVVVVLTLSRLPQVLESYRNLEKESSDAVSLSSLTISMCSSFCWEVFAILERRTVVMITTAIAITLTIAIVVLEYKGNRKRKVRS